MQNAVDKKTYYGGVSLEERQLLSQLFDSAVKESFDTPQFSPEPFSNQGGENDIIN